MGSAMWRSLLTLLIEAATLSNEAASSSEALAAAAVGIGLSASMCMYSLLVAPLCLRDSVVQALSLDSQLLS